MRSNFNFAFFKSPRSNIFQSGGMIWFCSFCMHEKKYVLWPLRTFLQNRKCPQYHTHHRTKCDGRIYTGCGSKKCKHCWRSPENRIFEVHTDLTEVTCSGLLNVEEIRGGALINIEKVVFFCLSGDPGFPCGVGEDLGIYQSTVITHCY